MLFSGLQGEEAFYRPPYHGLRHPFIFYYAHTGPSLAVAVLWQSWQLCTLLVLSRCT